MAEGSGVNKTQVLVAVITVVGGLLTAIIVNADKLFRNGKAPAASPPAVVTSSQPVSTASTPAAPIVDIGGEWRDDDGARFGFKQVGSTYEYTHTAINGTMQSAGKGTISGRDLSHTFEMATGETGTCTARVNEAANKITGSCLSPGVGGWTFVIER